MTRPADSVEFVFPDGLTGKQARRLLQITDALTDGGVPVEAMIDARLYDLSPPVCESCGCKLEAGHCYCCQPVSGYGHHFAQRRHGGGA